jgi:hypothetical protein
MLDHLHIIVVVAFSNAMRRLRRGQVTLHSLAENEQMFKHRISLQVLCIAPSQLSFQNSRKRDLAKCDLVWLGKRRSPSRNPDKLLSIHIPR